MKTVMLVVIGTLISAYTFAQTVDPMGLSEYVIQGSSDINHPDHRLTNHEVDIYKATGFILSDGSVKQEGGPTGAGYDGAQSTIKHEPAPKTPKKSKLDKDKGSTKRKYIPPDNPKLAKKPLPTSKQIAKQTKTKHKDHPKSNGTIEVRPTNFPDNPTRDDIVRMQQHIQHIERQVGRALDLSLSAYAVAELPQATEGRSGISVGGASAGGKTAEAIGYSSNFGDKHEYTVKISLSNSGHETAVGGGFSWQW